MSSEMNTETSTQLQEQELQNTVIKNLQKEIKSYQKQYLRMASERFDIDYKQLLEDFENGFPCQKT